MTKKGYPTINYDSYARSISVDDYWGQVKRTIKGKPIDQQQIKMIVSAIVSCLELNKNDLVLDLACGNGALSSLIFPYCAGVHGVDISPYLIDIANKVFSKPHRFTFEVSDVIDYLMNEKYPEQYGKVLIYGSFQYFPQLNSIRLLKSLYDRFINIKRIFIGNIPDRDKYSDYYIDRLSVDGELDDNEASIGIWYGHKELEQIATDLGWTVAIHYMPKEFYASYYRYDIVLER